MRPSRRVRRPRPTGSIDSITACCTGILDCCRELLDSERPGEEANNPAAKKKHGSSTPIADPVKGIHAANSTKAHRTSAGVCLEFFQLFSRNADLIKAAKQERGRRLVQFILPTSRLIRHFPRMAKPSALVDTRVIYCGDNLDQIAHKPA